MTSFAGPFGPQQPQAFSPSAGQMPWWLSPEMLFIGGGGAHGYSTQPGGSYGGDMVSMNGGGAMRPFFGGGQEMQRMGMGGMPQSRSPMGMYPMGPSQPPSPFFGPGLQGFQPRPFVGPGFMSGPSPRPYFDPGLQGGGMGQKPNWSAPPPWLASGGPLFQQQQQAPQSPPFFPGTVNDRARRGNSTTPTPPFNPGGGINDLTARRLR